MSWELSLQAAGWARPHSLSPSLPLSISPSLPLSLSASHDVNKTLGVFLYPDLGKKDYVNRSTADYCEGPGLLAAAPPPSLIPLTLSLCLSLHLYLLLQQSWAPGAASAPPSPPSSGPATLIGAGAA